MEDNFRGMTFEQKRTVRGIRDALIEKLEAAPKAPSLKNDVNYDYRFTPKGTLVMDFTISGAGLALRVRDKVEKRHPFVRLEFEMSGWSCTATICPAVIPGVKLSGSDSQRDSDTEKRLEEWSECIRKVFRQSDLGEVKITAGMLRDSSFRPAKCPHRAKIQAAAGCATAR